MSQELTIRAATDIAVKEFRDPRFLEQVQYALPENESPQKFVRALATALIDNASLVEADRTSLVQAVLKSAQDGLLPDGREAALVVFNTKVNNSWVKKIQYMPMIGGLRKFAAEHGWSIRTAVIHAGDSFAFDPVEVQIVHRPPRPGVDRGEPQGAWALGVHKDGRREAEVMTVSEIEKVRQVSRAKDKGPWVDWWEQMAEKTVGRRLFKKLPFDPKDRERFERIIDELEHGAATEMLYGEDSSRDRNRDEAPGAASTSPTPQGQQAGEGDTNAAPSSAASPDDAPIDIVGEEIPWDGNEPEPEPAEQADVPRFPMGKHEGKTVMEVFELGEDGVSYLGWALKNWRTEPMREALAEFAETHPEVKA